MKQYKFIQIHTDGSCVFNFLNPVLLKDSTTQIAPKFDERNFSFNQKIKKIRYDFDKAFKDKKKFLNHKKKI